MPLNTRACHREPVSTDVDIFIPVAATKSVKLNLPRSASQDSNITFKATLLDISICGCGIDSPYMIPAGLILNLSININIMAKEIGFARIDPIKVSGKVTSCSMKGSGHYRMGIFFTAISRDDQSFIDNFIKSRQPKKTQS